MWLNKLNTPQSFYLNILRVLKFAEINKPLYPQKISVLSSQTIAMQSHIPSYWLYKCTHNISQTFWLDKPICSRIRRNMHRFFRFLSQKAHMCLSKNRNLWIINNVGKCRKRKRDTKKLNKKRHISSGKVSNLLEYLFYFRQLEAWIGGMKRQNENASYTNVMCLVPRMYSS